MGMTMTDRGVGAAQRSAGANTNARQGQAANQTASQAGDKAGDKAKAAGTAQGCIAADQRASGGAGAGSSSLSLSQQAAKPAQQPQGAQAAQAQQAKEQNAQPQKFYQDPYGGIKPDVAPTAKPPESRGMVGRFVDRMLTQLDGMYGLR